MDIAVTTIMYKGDEKDSSRWWISRLTQTYVPYPDTKTAATLCIGGLVKYTFKKESKVIDCRIVE